MQIPRNSTPQYEHRLKQRERVEAAPLMATKFPHLRGLTARLEFFDARGITKQSEMKYKLNLEHAKSALWFACPGVECVCGDFDMSEVLTNAVADRRKVVVGDLHCGGTRKRGERVPEVCGTLLRYKLTLDYD